MIKPKFSIIILLLFSILLTLNGCWDAREFERLALIKGIAVDITEEGRFKYSLQIIEEESPDIEMGGDISVGIISSTGYTLFEANRNLIKHLARIPFYGHNEVIIISEEAAQRGINCCMDYFLRNKEIRGHSSIAISRGEALEILKKPHEFSRVSAQEIHRMLDGVSVAGTIIKSEILDLRRVILNPYKEALVSSIELRPGAPEMDNNNEENEENLLFAEGGAIFREDKLVGWLTRREARGYNWIHMPHEIRGPIIVQTDNENNHNRVSIEIYRGQSKIKPHFHEGEFSIEIDIETEGFIIESLDQDIRLTNEENLASLDRRYAQVVRNEILNALEKSRQYESDFLGLADAIYKKYPREFKEIEDEWDDIFQTIPVTVNVQAGIRRTGMTN